jgi:hypothetical protein
MKFKIKLGITSFFLAFASLIQAQSSINLKGKVIDKISKETIPGAKVSLPEHFLTTLENLSSLLKKAYHE